MKRRRDSILLSLSLFLIKSKRVHRMQAIARSSRTFSLFCRPLRRGKSASKDPSLVSLRTRLSFDSYTSPAHPCVLQLREGMLICHAAGTRNGQRPLETIIELWGPLRLFLLVTPFHPVLRIFNPTTAISGKALSPGQAPASSSRFLITVMAARRGARVETPIERWKLRR